MMLTQFLDTRNPNNCTATYQSLVKPFIDLSSSGLSPTCPLSPEFKEIALPKKGMQPKPHFIDDFHSRALFPHLKSYDLGKFLNNNSKAISKTRTNPGTSARELDHACPSKGKGREISIYDVYRGLQYF